jgi:uncharacterized membrane protein YccC
LTDPYQVVTTIRQTDQLRGFKSFAKAWEDLNKKGMPLARHRARLGLVLRMMISTALATALHQTQAYWAVLTAIIVTESSVGGSLKTAIDRPVGSICGALIGALAAVLLPAHTPIILGLVLVGAITPLVLLTAYAPHYRIAPVTAVIVLLSSSSATLGPLGYALNRVMEITLGSVVGVAVSVLIAPARAHGHLREAAAEIALLLGARSALRRTGSR